MTKFSQAETTTHTEYGDISKETYYELKPSGPMAYAEWIAQGHLPDEDITVLGGSAGIGVAGGSFSLSENFQTGEKTVEFDLSAGGVGGSGKIVTDEDGNILSSEYFGGGKAIVSAKGDLLGVSLGLEADVEVGFFLDGDGLSFGNNFSLKGGIFFIEGEINEKNDIEIVDFNNMRCDELRGEHPNDENSPFPNWLQRVFYDLSADLEDPTPCPLVLDLDGDGIELTALDGSSVYFDLNINGFAELTGWVSPDDALLALDVSGINVNRINPCAINLNAANGNHSPSIKPVA